MKNVLLKIKNSIFKKNYNFRVNHFFIGVISFVN